MGVKLFEHGLFLNQKTSLGRGISLLQDSTIEEEAWFHAVKEIFTPWKICGTIQYTGFQSEKTKFNL